MRLTAVLHVGRPDSLHPAAGLARREGGEGLGRGAGVERRVRRLMDQQRDPGLAQDRRRRPRLLGGVRGDARIQRLTLGNGGVQRAHRLLERRLGIEAMRVEDVDVVDTETPEGLIETC